MCSGPACKHEPTDLPSASDQQARRSGHSNQENLPTLLRRLRSVDPSRIFSVNPDGTFSSTGVDGTFSMIEGGEFWANLRSTPSANGHGTLSTRRDSAGGQNDALSTAAETGKTPSMSPVMPVAPVEKPAGPPASGRGEASSDPQPEAGGAGTAKGSVGPNLAVSEKQDLQYQTPALAVLRRDPGFYSYPSHSGFQNHPAHSFYDPARNPSYDHPTPEQLELMGVFHETEILLAETVNRIAGTDTGEAKILLGRWVPSPALPVRLTETEAIERLRTLNHNPEMTLTLERREALTRVRQQVVTNTELQEAPIILFAASVFMDLDKGLFDNMLHRRVHLGQETGERGLAGFTDMWCHRGVRICLSGRHYDGTGKRWPNGESRLADALATLVHEMCHAYLRSYCGWPRPGDVAYGLDQKGDNQHGVWFGQILYLVQKVMHNACYLVDLGDNRLFPMYELVRRS